MKKIAAILVAMFLLMSLTGCASLIKSSGGVMREDLALRDAGVDKEFAALNDKLSKQNLAMEQLLKAVNEKLAAREAAETQQIQAVNDKITVLTADVETTKAAAAEIEKAKASIAELLAKLDTMSDQTLLRLAKLIQDALAAAQGGAAAAPASAAAPAEAPK